MPEIIGFVQVKGGAGRSTLATNTAAMLSRRHRTALIDCDLPQGTSASWYVTRKAANLAGDLTLATAKDHRELVELVKRLSADHQRIVIDAPPPYRGDDAGNPHPFAPSPYPARSECG